MQLKITENKVIEVGDDYNGMEEIILGNLVQLKTHIATCEFDSIEEFKNIIKEHQAFKRFENRNKFLLFRKKLKHSANIDEMIDLANDVIITNRPWLEFDLI